MGHRGNHVLTVTVEMPVERETVPGDESVDVALAADHELRGLDSLHAGPGDLLAFVLLLVSARVIVYLQLGSIAAHIELVRYLADLHIGHDLLVRLQVVVMRQLEVMVPQRELSGVPALCFLPVEDARLIPLSTLNVVVHNSRVAWDIGMRHGGVPQHELVAVAGLLEEIEDALFFHQAGSELEVRLAVLDTVLSRRVATPQVVIRVDPIEHFFQNVGDFFLLEDAALPLARQLPDAGGDGSAVVSHAFARGQLGERGHNALDMALLRAVRPVDAEADLAAEEAGKVDLLVLRQQLQLE